MILLDRPYVSDFLLSYLNTSRQPVLRTPFTSALAQKKPIVLVDDAEAESRCRSGERLYVSSENALDWIYRHLHGTHFDSIALMKNKTTLREKLACLCPNFFFRAIALRDLASVDTSTWPKPFVLKPAVGFFSLGVYTIASDADWQHALADINRFTESGSSGFPDNVLSTSVFLAEEYIKGTEYAVDVYFDSVGVPVILNIFEHRFASSQDVSDRLYVSGRRVILSMLPRLQVFFSRVNELLHLRDFPIHAELRVTGENILPIEFNPMRFAGLCTTELAAYAFGVNTVDMYLNDQKPDLAAILEKKGDLEYAMIVLNKPAPDISSKLFDYEKLSSTLHGILDLRKIDLPELPTFGFVFTATDNEHSGELRHILQSDLREFLSPSH